MKKSFWNRALWPLLGLGLLAVVVLQARAAVTTARPGRAGSPRRRLPATAAGPWVAAKGGSSPIPGAEVVVGTDLAGTLVVLKVQEKQTRPPRPAPRRAALRRPPRRARRGPGTRRGSRRRHPPRRDRGRARAVALGEGRRIPAGGRQGRARRRRRPRPPRHRRRRRPTGSQPCSPRRGSSRRSTASSSLGTPTRARRWRPGQRILTVADLSRVRIEAELDEFDAGRVAARRRGRSPPRATTDTPGRAGRGDPRRRRRAPPQAPGPRQARGHARPSRQDRVSGTDAPEARPARGDPHRESVRGMPEVGHEQRTASQDLPVPRGRVRHGAGPARFVRRARLPARAHRRSTPSRPSCASFAFFLAGFAIEGLWPPRVGRRRRLARPDILFHLAACAVLLLDVGRGAAAGALRLGAALRGRRRDARDVRPLRLHGRQHAGGVAARDAVHADRHDVLLYRAAIVPSIRCAHRVDLDPVRRAGADPGGGDLCRDAPGRKSRAGQSVAYALLWAAARGISGSTLRLVRDVPPAQERGPRAQPRPVHAGREARRGRDGHRLPRRARDAPPPHGDQAAAAGHAPARTASSASSARSSRRRG